MSDTDQLALPAWGDVLAAALVGTDRRQLPGLLDAAAAHGLRRRAGARPATGVPLPAPAPPEASPPVSAPAAARLAGLLEQDEGGWPGPAGDAAQVDADTRLALVAEWLEAGRRVPGELLPALLDLGRRHRWLRPAIVAAGGTRVGWLAAQRPEWTYLAAVSDEIELDPAWDLAPIGGRVGHLTVLRRRDPGAARDLLAAAWPNETPEDKVALLRTLSTGLSTMDEVLLERALDDRRRDVRAAAVELLARLPDSAYGRRMATRARACLRREADRIVVNPPTECDPQLLRDGVNPKAPAGVGARAWWLEELLARTPLVTWIPSLAASPAAVLALPAGEWAGVVHRGLARAAAAQSGGAWATALVDRLWPQAVSAQRLDDRLLLESLYGALPAADRANRAASVLRQDPAQASAAGVQRLLELCARPWPPPLADAVLAVPEALLAARTGAPSVRLMGLCKLAAVRLPVSTVDAAEALRDRVALARPNYPVRAVELLADILRFRHEMLEELG